MEKRTLIVFILVALILTTIALILIQVKKPDFAPKESDLEECKTIQNNGGSTNIVFFSTKEQAQDYSNFLLNSEPYKEFKDSFNIFYIDDYVPNCEIYEGMAILCKSKEIIRKAASCPNDLIIVLQDQPRSIRSSAYENIMSINSNHNKNVILHEFGHAFANLADEYVPAQIPKRSENCAGNCVEFGENSECFQGCSNNNHYRSINSGVMKTLSSSEYGDFDEEIILSKISPQETKFTGSAIEETRDCDQEEYLLVEGNYNQGEIEIKSKNVEQGCVGKNGVGGIDYKLFTEKNEIYAETFNPELIFIDAEGQEYINGGTLENSGEFYLKIPIIPNAQKLEISSEGRILSEINLQDTYSRPCKI